MTETLPGQLLTMSSAAAQNIAAALDLHERASEIEQAIKDEISALSTHFALTFADIKAQYESDLKAHKRLWVTVVAVAFSVGALVGHLI